MTKVLKQQRTKLRLELTASTALQVADVDDDLTRELAFYNQAWPSVVNYISSACVCRLYTHNVVK